MDTLYKKSPQTDAKWRRVGKRGGQRPQPTKLSPKKSCKKDLVVFAALANKKHETSYPVHSLPAEQLIQQKNLNNFSQ